MDKDRQVAPTEGSPVDNQIARTLSRWAKATSSRRSFLARVGKATIALTGASLMQALPSDRRLVGAAAYNCYDWKWCYMGGYPCASCHGDYGYGTDSSCPSPGCSTAGNPWYGCCSPDGGSTLRLIEYRDCCAIGGCYDRLGCDSKCENAQTQYWCNGGDADNYRCTLANIVGAC